MPSLWKSGKIARLSGFVSDLRVRRSRGSSLLVETGFPTSLADFIVKNRTRLKKPLLSPPPPLPRPSKKKIACADCAPAADSASLPEILPDVDFPSNGGSASGVSGEVGQLELPCLGYECFNDTAKVSGSRWFLLIVKLLFLLVLALETKDIALPIAISTFFLLLLESVGKHLSSFWLQNRVAGMDLNHVYAVIPNESPLGSSVCERDLILQRVAIVSTGEISVPGACSGDEIQSVESDCNLFKIKNEFDRVVEERGGEILAAEDDDKFLVKEKKSINVKLKSSVFKLKFLKKLMSKRFNGSKKGLSRDEKWDSRSKTPEIEGPVEHVEEEARVAEDEFFVSASSKNSSPVNSEDLGLTKGCKKEHWKLGYLVSFTIVLLGLVGGRSCALLLTLLWFLLVKSADAVWSHFQKMHKSREKNLFCLFGNFDV